MTEGINGGRLEDVFAEARRRSLIGSLPVPAQIAHSEGFLRALSSEHVDGPVLELGSGGGLPGLVFAVEDPDLRLVLLDSSRRSTDFLRWAVAELQLSERVEVVNMRAEQAGRDGRYRGSFAAVVARSFGPPAVTAECAAPLLRVGGRLLVAEPPLDPSSAGSMSRDARRAASRWPVEGCAEFGLVPELELREPFGFAVLRQDHPCPERYPRRPGIPNKRPLFA
ncbi:MAG TPA: RsmG family class I SAM-dependent methyltransferase [Acidimicrobiales bacterium]|nr:RsmG family class I SAM-dependent methyltransferase [Acidimicrobiales bacterium]